MREPPGLWRELVTLPAASTMELLVTGGVDNNDNTLKDAWILDANTGRWVKVSADVHMNMRLRKSAVEINSEFTSIVCYVDSPQLM